MAQKLASAIALGVVALNTASGLVLPAVPTSITKLDTRTTRSSWVNNNHLVARTRAFDEDGDVPEASSGESSTPFNRGGHRAPSLSAESISTNSDSPPNSHRSPSSEGFKGPDGQSSQHEDDDENNDIQSDEGEFRRRDSRSTGVAYHHLVSRAAGGLDKDKSKKKGSVLNKVLQPFKKGGNDGGTSDGDSSTASSWGIEDMWDALSTQQPGSPVAGQSEDEGQGAQTGGDNGEKISVNEKVKSSGKKEGGDDKDTGSVSGSPGSSRVKGRRETVEDDEVEEFDSIDDMD